MHGGWVVQYGSQTRCQKRFVHDGDALAFDKHHCLKRESGYTGVVSELRVCQSDGMIRRRR